MAVITVTSTPVDLNVTTTQSNITVTDLETNVTVNVASLSSNITVSSTPVNVVLAPSIGVSNAEIRSAISATAPLTYDSVNGVFGFDPSSNNMQVTSLTASSFVTTSGNLTASGLTVTNNATINGQLTVANISIGGDLNANLKDISLSYYNAGNVSGNVTLDVSNGPVQKIRLTNNLTGLSFTGATAAQPITVIIQQDNVGFWTLDTTTYASNWTDWLFTSNFKSLTTTANAYDYLSITYDGVKYYASLVNFFQSQITNSELSNSNVIVNGTTINLGSSGNISHFGSLTTTALPEGTNLYFTAARARGNISAVAPITYNSGTGQIGFADLAQIGGLTVNGTGAYPGVSLIATKYLTSNVAHFIGNVWVTEKITATGNVQGNYILGNGAFLTGVTSLTNAQVLSYIATQPLTVGGNLTVNGNINATGNINVQNVEDLYVRDRTIVLNANAASAANVQIVANRPSLTNVELKWNETTDRWTFTNNGTTYFNMPESTTDVAEGANLYYTTARANTAIGAYQGNINTPGTVIAGVSNATTVNATTINTTDLTATNNVTVLGKLNAADGSNIQYVRAYSADFIIENTAASLAILMESESNNRISKGNAALRYVPATKTLFLSEGTIGSNDTNLQGNNLIIGNVTASGAVTATGNVQGAFIKGNGSQLTNLPANVAGSENITVTGNVVSLKNALSNVNSVTVETGQNFTINSTNKLVLTQQFKNTTTQTGNVTSDGYALFGGVNQSYLDPGFTYSGATNLDSIFLDSVTYTAGSNALTGVSISSTYAGDPATINSVLPYYVWTPTLPTAIGGTGSTSFQTPFPYGTYVTSVDAANSIIYLSQASSTTGTVAEGGLQPGAYDSSTGLLLSFISEYDNTGGGGSSTTIDVTFIHKFGAYGYPKSGVANTDFAYAIGNSSNYAVSTSNGRPISEYMIGRTKIESDSIVLQAPRGLLVGNADMSVRSEGAAGPSFGVNVLWDGTANTTLEYGGATPVTQVLINQYSDGSPANVSGNETFTGPRILFTAARGNKNQDPSQTYARVNNELGRISWWTAAKNNLQLSTTSPPAWISAVSGNDHITYNSGLGLYFANSPNIDSTGRALYLASSKGNTLISSAVNNSGVHQPIIFAPAHVTTSGNSVYHYNQTVVGADNLASTSETPSGAHFGQFNYANTSALTGSRFSVTNGNNSTTQREGNIALSIDRNLNNATVTHFCRTGAVNYLGSSSPDRIRFTYTPQGLANATPVTISGFTNATVAGALNGNVFYVKGPFSAGGGLFSDYELYSDSGLTTGVNLGVTNINAGPGAITFTRTNGVTAKDWSFVLAQGSNSLVLAEDGVTRTTFAGGNITASYFIGDGSALTNVSATGFTNFAVSGQSTVVADTAGDTMTLVAGSGMTITTDAATDTITFTSTGGYGNVEVANFLANGYGSNTISTTGNITAGNTIVNGVVFNNTGITSPSSGQIVYNSTYGTHQVGLNGSNVMLMGQDLVVYAVNDEANTLSKGEVVYISGATGNHATVRRAINNSDNNSATTIGIVKSDIASGALGYIVSQGVVDGLNLGAYTAGDKLYLGNVAGTFTNVKPSSPEHYVFIGVVERANAGNGQILVRVQNGFELDEIHDIKLTSVQQNDILVRNSGNSLWVNQNFGTTVTNSNITLKQFAETKVDLGTTNGNITLNMANGSIFTMTANGNISNIALANASIGSSGTLIITQDNVGSRLMTVTSAWKFAGASKTLTTTANAIDIVNFFTDGTTVYAALSKGYA